MSSKGAITKAQLQDVKDRAFIPSYQATDEEALGIVIAQYTQWDGAAIFRALGYALEDANFHSEYAELRERYAWAWANDEAEVSETI